MGRIATKLATKAIPSKAPKRIFGASAVASLAFHAVLAASWAVLAVRPSQAPLGVAPFEAKPVDVSVDLDLPTGSAALLDVERLPDPEGIPPLPLAGAMTAQLDDGLRGRGGEARAREHATNLADRDEAMHASPDLLNHFDRDQVQRLRTAKERAAWEDRRATTHPMELTFVAVGKGRTEERRPKAAFDPSRGLMRSLPADTAGGHAGAPDEMSDAPSRNAGDDSSKSGSRDAHAGLGLSTRAPGKDHRNEAAVADVRPSVVAGRPTVPATKVARPSDNVDSEQEVSDIVRSIVHASTTGGLEGQGRGGTAGGDTRGAGSAEGHGSASSPMGLASGDPIDFGTRDPRLLAYFRKLHAKIDPEWRNAFPQEAALALRQGTVILDFVVSESGVARVVWPPTRPSGIEAFDANCAAAIKRAGPFEPIPKELGVHELHVRAPFVASNPIVR